VTDVTSDDTSAGIGTGVTGDEVTSDGPLAGIGTLEKREDFESRSNKLNMRNTDLAHIYFPLQNLYLIHI
jgi:hypothetical protein